VAPIPSHSPGHQPARSRCLPHGQRSQDFRHQQVRAKLPTSNLYICDAASSPPKPTRTGTMPLVAFTMPLATPDRQLSVWRPQRAKPRLCSGVFRPFFSLSLLELQLCFTCVPSLHSLSFLLLAFRFSLCLCDLWAIVLFDVSACYHPYKTFNQRIPHGPALAFFHNPIRDRNPHHHHSHIGSQPLRRVSPTGPPTICPPPSTALGIVHLCLLKNSFSNPVAVPDERHHISHGRLHSPPAASTPPNSLSILSGIE